MNKKSKNDIPFWIPVLFIWILIVYIVLIAKLDNRTERIEYLETQIAIERIDHE